MDPVPEPRTGIAFGRFQVSPGRREVLADGKPVKLGGRAFDILLALIDARGSTVSKEMLMARVWPGQTIGENSLQVQIAALRAAFGPERGLIRTVAGRGYQFTGDIRGVPVSPSEHAGAATAQPAAVRPPTNVPEPVSELIGRDAEVAAVLDLIGRHRFVTLVGAGGIGKTRLAHAVARRLYQQFPDQFPDGVWLAEFSPLADAGLVPATVAAAAGLQLGAGDMSPRLVSEVLANRRLLIILDTCEHVIGAAAAMAEALLWAGSGVRIIATSREPLRAEGEQIYPVPPLAVPVAERDDPWRFGAVALFVVRSRAGGAHVSEDRRIAPVIAGICRRLDGIPLAIELAAARAATLGIEALGSHLDDRFRLLTGGWRTALPRHQTLQATLDWSYELLTEPERMVLHRLAVFAGAFDLAAAGAVVISSELSSAKVVEALSGLVAKSLVVTEVEGASVRYRLLDTTRAYALKKLDESGERERFLRSHAEYYRYLFERAEVESETRPTAEWLDDYGWCIGNLRAALDWAMQPEGDAELGISLTANAVTLWSQLSLFRELQQRAEQALEGLGDAAAQGATREMKLFAGLSTAEVQVYESTPKGTAACRAALGIARRIGNDSYQAKSLLALWNGCFATGEVRHSLELAEEFMRVAARLGHADVLVAHRMLGSSHFYLGDVVTARRHMETMVAGYAATAHGVHMARFSFGQLASGLALLSFYLGFQGYVDQAMQMLRQSVDEALRTNHAMTACGILGTNSIRLSIYFGYLDEARRYLEILYDRARGHGLLRSESLARGYDGILCIRQGQLHEGLRKLSSSFVPTEDRSNTRYTQIFCEHALATGLAGNPQGGLRAIAEIHDRSVATGIRWCLPEVYRCRARLLEMSGGEPADVEAAFREALSLAEATGALTWRLLAARDFAAFLGGRGRAHEAFEILSGVYNMFTEGHASPILLAAREQLRNFGGDGADEPARAAMEYQARD